MTEPLRCLSVRQPWAWAICAGVKKIENRVWQTEHRGPIAIQAGKSKVMLKEMAANGLDLSPDLFEFGAIIGIAQLVDITPIKEERGNPWAVGPYCLHLGSAYFLREPIPARGSLQLVRLKDDVSDQVRRALPYDVKSNERKQWNEVGATIEAWLKRT